MSVSSQTHSHFSDSHPGAPAHRQISSDQDQHPLDPARGIALAMIFAVPAWALIGAVVWFLVH